jgi:hypothetical protein
MWVGRGHPSETVGGHLLLFHFLSELLCAPQLKLGDLFRATEKSRKWWEVCELSGAENAKLLGGEGPRGLLCNFPWLSLFLEKLWVHPSLEDPGRVPEGLRGSPVVPTAQVPEIGVQIWWQCPSCWGHPSGLASLEVQLIPQAVEAHRASTHPGCVPSFGPGLKHLNVYQNWPRFQLNPIPWLQADAAGVWETVMGLWTSRECKMLCGASWRDKEGKSRFCGSHTAGYSPQEGTKFTVKTSMAPARKGGGLWTIRGLNQLQSEACPLSNLWTGTVMKIRRSPL